MSKSDASVEQLVSMIERGQLRLPEMQRRYVWRSTRVRDLMDSLYRGYPSGAILLWETNEEVPLQDFAVTQQGNPYQSSLLLLDGQQRLTSLSAVVRGEPVTVRGRKRPLELLFNLEHPDHLTVVTEVDEDGEDEDEDDIDEDADDLEADEADSSEDELFKRFNRMTFVVASRKLEQSPNWVKVSEVFKSESDRPFLKRAGITDLDDPRGEKYSQRLAKLRAIKKYMYRMDILESTLSYEEVTEIFVRVNSLGAKLRSSDLALAQITAKWRGALAIFQSFQKECADDGFDLDLGVFLKNLVVFATGQSRFQTVNNLSIDTLKKAWEESRQGMEFSINFLKNNVGIDNPVLLSSNLLLITLAYYGHNREYKIAPDEAVRLRHWALLANAKGRYSRGSGDTLIEQDLNTLKKDTPDSPEGFADELLDRLRTQVGRLDIQPEELEGRNQASALFKTMFLAFRDAGAKDWDSNLIIGLRHKGAHHRLQFHHIFPKAILKRTFNVREVNDISNLAFIGGRTNRAISDKPPAKYFPAILGNGGQPLMGAQCIPTDDHLLDVEAYKGFLIERRKRISQRLNEFLGV
jgi:hypothetical protein